MRSEEEGGTGIPTAEEVLIAYASKWHRSERSLVVNTYVHLVSRTWFHEVRHGQSRRVPRCSMDS
jgi:hypothetical protein